MQLQRPFDPVVTFQNSQGETARGTITSLQRRALVMEIYNPYSIVQVSEVLDDLVIRSGDRSIYKGKAVVVSLLNTGLMAVVSLALIDEWSDLNLAHGDPKKIGAETVRFISDWEDRFRIRESYQVAISEFRSFLSETARWIDQSDMNDSLPKSANGRLTDEVFWALAEPLMAKSKSYLARLEAEAADIPPEDSLLHRAFAQAALHPLILKAPFVYRTFAKPLGYAGDYEMVNQLLGDPRQGSSTYIELVNAVFIKSAVAQAHRNRVDILVNYLGRAIALAKSENRQVKILNIGCGPAAEIQQLIQIHKDLENIEFTLMDFSEETLNYTKSKLDQAAKACNNVVNVKYIQESVHDLLKRNSRSAKIGNDTYDFIYCAGLFDYLSDKVCTRLIRFFLSKAKVGTQLLLTNVHSSNPEKHGMEHLLEWHLIYRDEAQMSKIMSEVDASVHLFTDETGVNVFAEATLESIPNGERAPE